jgi:predicted dehydrogenase
MTRLNIGIIGPGLMGSAHAMFLMSAIEQNLFDGSDVCIKGMADIDEATLAMRGDLYDVELRTTDGHELCASPDIDVVWICTPTRYHAEFFMDAAEHGKHVFLEKPAGTAVQVREMMEARDRAGIKVQVGLVLRYEPLFWMIKKIMVDHADEFGPLQNVIFRDDQTYPYTGGGTHPSTWRADKDMAFHGTLFEHSIHDLDELMLYCGDVASLAASVKFFDGKEDIEDSVSVLLNFKGGATASLNSIWYGANRDTRRGEFYFKNAVMEYESAELGSALLSYKICDSKTVKVKSDEMTKAFLAEVFSGLAVPPSISYLYEDASFLRAIIDGTDPHPSLETALAVHDVIEKCYESSLDGKFIMM